MMSDDLRYQIHLRRLNQIKKRVNHYPIYKINIKGAKSPSLKEKKIYQLKTEIKANDANISLVKKDFKKKKPIYYENDKFLYEREVENIQKKFINQLIKNNRELKKQVKDLQKNIFYKKNNK